MSTGSSFLAVDLDAVLDDFESQQEEQQRQLLASNPTANTPLTEKTGDTRSEGNGNNNLEEPDHGNNTVNDTDNDMVEDTANYKVKLYETIKGAMEEAGQKNLENAKGLEGVDDKDSLEEATKKKQEEYAVRKETSIQKPMELEHTEEQITLGQPVANVQHQPEIDKTSCSGILEPQENTEDLEASSQTEEDPHDAEGSENSQVMPCSSPIDSHDKSAKSCVVESDLNATPEPFVIDNIKSDVSHDGISSSSSSSPPFESCYDSSADHDLGFHLTSEPHLTLGATGARPKEVSLAALNLCEAETTPNKDEEGGEVTVTSESPPPYSEIDPMSSNVENETLDSLPTSLADTDDPGNGRNTDTSATSNPLFQTEDSLSELLRDLTEEQLMLGKVCPHWVPDNDALSCMICNMKFTLVKRRHHCRTCGKVLCSSCCSDKAEIPFMENKLARVCKPCLVILEKLKKAESSQRGNANTEANGADASSTLDQHQSPSHLQPAGVLKHVNESNEAVSENQACGGSSNVGSEPKQVMFSDGIKPGGDLADLDGSSEYQRQSATALSRRRKHKKSLKSTAEVGKSLIPHEEDEMPIIMGDVMSRSARECGRIVMESPDPVIFKLNRNLKVHVKLIIYPPISQEIWSYRSEGLSSVGQDEVVFLLVREPEEEAVHKDILEQFQTVYERARAGRPVIELSYSIILSGKPFLNTLEYGGILYVRHTFQSTENLDLPPDPPYLFAILITKLEIPWARVFPMRLMLRLGAEKRFYPSPLWNERGRKSVYWEIGNTIMNLLCDFKNYAYSVPLISGLSIKMELKLTTISLPKDRFRQIQKALVNSNEAVLALAATFCRMADSHLVAVQKNAADNGHSGQVNYSDYETQAINIMNKTREVTGASFVIFNGALKSSSGLTAKSSIVEDGIMIQVSSDRMLELRKCLEKMEDFDINCGPISSAEPDEVVKLKWVNTNESLNPGIKSCIDSTLLESVSSIRLHSGRDYVNDKANLFIRWCEVFLIRNNEHHDFIEFDPPDPMSVASMIAKATCSGLVIHLKRLKESNMSKLAVRVNLDPDNGGYEAGSNGQHLDGEVMKSLDSALVPIILGDISSQRITIELLFQILEL